MTEPVAASPRVDPSAFDLPGKGRAAALCLHGLTGTPYEVRPLAEAISAAGIRAVGPALPGHNETPERLAATSHTDFGSKPPEPNSSAFARAANRFSSSGCRWADCSRSRSPRKNRSTRWW